MGPSWFEDFYQPAGRRGAPYLDELSAAREQDIDTTANGAVAARLREMTLADADLTVILTRFGVKSASKIDHPILFTALPAVRSELGCRHRGLRRGPQ
jgi:hypothetical protein